MSRENTPSIAVIGAGLAGCECAMALARAGVPCTLFEMKPLRFSPAHSNPDLAELVCSNSLRSNDPASAVGALKNELRALGSLTMLAADNARVPAGKALAVDRARFSAHITRLVEAEPLIRLERREIPSLEHFDFETLRQDTAPSGLPPPTPAGGGGGPPPPPPPTHHGG
ncbi:MAG: FAD-dependent oxidoreductase, partial [Deltaproteobacteria bacterium]|nr:FAD-dependent oxidoreductase [Deltaproteobacteria bacterium]